MSVINSVLRDLEARKSRFTPIRLDPLEPAAHRRDYRIPALAAFALMLVAGVAGWLTWPAPATREAAVPAPAAVPAATTPPDNQIVGLQLRETADGLRLEFVLRDPAVAYLRASDGDRYGYHLRAIGSRIEAPVIGQSRWLEALELEARDGGIDIDFVTAPGVLVESRQDRGDGGPVWAIELRRAPLAAAEPQPAQAAVASAVAAAAEPRPAPAAAAAPRPAQTDAGGAGEAVASVAAVARVAPAGKAARTAPPVAAAAATADPADPNEVRVRIESTDPDAPALNRVHYATDLIKAGRDADAESLLTSLLDGAADLAARQRLLALYQLRARERDFARLAQASIERYPEVALFRTEYGRLLLKSAAYHRVIALFTPATGLDADQQALLAAAFQRLDRHADAIRHYALALELDAGNARHWIGLGISQEQVAALEDALDSYRKAARLGPPSERLRAFVAARTESLTRVLN